MQLHKPAPEFSLRDLEGRQHSAAMYRGRILVLNFWSAECPWAKRADLELQAYLKEWGQSVMLLSLAANSNESLSDIRCTAAERHLAPVLLAAGTSIIDDYAARTTPHCFVIDAQGILRYRGAFDDVTFKQRAPTHNYLHAAVQSLLTGILPDPAETPAYGCTIVRQGG